MSRLPKARKDAILSKMLAPYPIRIRQLALQENLSEATLCHWRNQLRQEGCPCQNTIAVLKTGLLKPALLWLSTPLLLSDQSRYLASESTMYRVLRQANQLQHRGRADKAARKAKPTSCHRAQVWMWDITWLPGRSKASITSCI